MDSRGATVHIVASNRAGFRHDAVKDGALLAANGTKTVKILDAKGAVATATHLTITNRSGQRAALLLEVGKSGDVHKQQIDKATGAVSDTVRRDTEFSVDPIRLLDGETIEVYERVVSIKETNEGAGTQTGIGVRYSATLEPKYR